MSIIYFWITKYLHCIYMYILVFTAPRDMYRNIYFSSLYIHFPRTCAFLRRSTLVEATAETAENRGAFICSHIPFSGPNLSSPCVLEIVTMRSETQHETHWKRHRSVLWSLNWLIGTESITASSEGESERGLIREFLLAECAQSHICSLVDVESTTTAGKETLSLSTSDAGWVTFSELDSNWRCRNGELHAKSVTFSTTILRTTIAHGREEN